MLKKQIMISGDKMKLNNKGFAITTILYGTMVLFLMLSVASLGIMSTYKIRMDKLINEEEGAECIVSGECVESKPQYKKQLCTATRNRYFCTGSGVLLYNEKCYSQSAYYAGQSFTYDECMNDMNVTGTHYYIYGRCYDQMCNPASTGNAWCGGACTIGVCECGTWGAAEWSDTDCGDLNSKACRILETR